MKFPVKDFFSKCDKIMENFIFLCSGIIKTMVGYERTFKSDSQSLAAVTKQLNDWVSGLMNKLNYTLMVLGVLFCFTWKYKLISLFIFFFPFFIAYFCMTVLLLLLLLLFMLQICFY